MLFLRVPNCFVGRPRASATASVQCQWSRGTKRNDIDERKNLTPCSSSSSSSPLILPSFQFWSPFPRRLTSIAATSRASSSSSSHDRSSRKKSQRQRSGGRGRHEEEEEEKKKKKNEPIRLGKALSQAGVASRRKSEDIIFQGRVSVNGEVVTKPETRVKWGKDRIELDGVSLVSSSSTRRGPGGGNSTGSSSDFSKFHFMINKPKGYICSNDASKKSVVELFGPWIERYMEKQERKREGRGGGKVSDFEGGDADKLVFPPRLFTVGRLDVATTGLLLVTNDGEWANRIAHPKYGVLKEYIVTTTQKVKPMHLEKIAEGTEVEGTFVVPKGVYSFDRRTGDPKHEYKVKVVVGEGKKHEVRELVANAGLQVTALKRVRIGQLSLQDLPIGKFRGLRKRELELPKKNVQL